MGFRSVLALASVSALVISCIGQPTLSDPCGVSECPDSGGDSGDDSGGDSGGDSDADPGGDSGGDSNGNSGGDSNASADDDSGGGGPVGVGIGDGTVLTPDPDVNPPGLSGGFTQFFQSADTKVYFVSEDGNDSNNGLTKSTPLRTADKALSLVRSGFPDWILFQRGDQFSGLGQLKKSGRSMAEPLLIGSYGDAVERPRFQRGLSTTGGGGGPPSTDYIAVVGLEFYNHLADPENPNFSVNQNREAVSWLRGTTGLWIEDCVFRFGQVNFQDLDGVAAKNVTLFRSQFLDSYSVTGHAQGLYASGTIGLTIDGCLFDHNGWNDAISDAESTIFNHNIYLQNGSPGSTLRHSIVMRASSHGLQFRPGGVVHGNFLFRNPINVLVGGGTNPDVGGVQGTVTDNVILEGVNMDSGESRGWGIDLENIDTSKTTLVDNNIIAKCMGSMCKIMDAGVAGVTYSNNTVQDWGNSSTPGPVPATLLDYAQSIGINSLDAFYAAVRTQSRSSWRTELSAPAITAYFQAEFAN